MTYRRSNSRKSNFATEPVLFITSLFPVIPPLFSTLSGSPSFGFRHATYATSCRTSDSITSDARPARRPRCRLAAAVAPRAGGGGKGRLIFLSFHSQAVHTRTAADCVAPPGASAQRVFRVARRRAAHSLPHGARHRARKDAGPCPTPLPPGAPGSSSPRASRLHLW